MSLQVHGNGVFIGICGVAFTAQSWFTSDIHASTAERCTGSLLMALAIIICEIAETRAAIVEQAKRSAGKDND